MTLRDFGLRSRSAALLASLLVAAACGDKDTGSGDDGTDDSGSTGDLFTDIINVDVEPIGDFSCYDGTTWTSQTPDPSCQIDGTFEGVIRDFETDDPVSDATLELYFNDRYSSSGADWTDIGDSDGVISGDTRTCSPLTYRVTTDPDLADTVITIQAHEVYPYSTTELTGEFISVSTTTYNLIPSLLGISVQAGEGIVAGTAFDCDGDGSPIEGAQVIVRNEAGEYVEDQQVKYFVPTSDDSSFPNRDQPYTSSDGLWVAVNIPPGRVTVEMWTWDGSAHVLKGEVPLDIVADSINIANVFTGFGGESGGIVYPESCLSACGE